MNKFNASHQRKKVELVVVHNEKCKGDKGINAHSYFDDSEVKRITRPDCIESLDYEEIAKQAMIDIEVDFTME
ncbi:MAG: hypothetical protein LBP53_02755 [Candidatus Peribacteria bacterium]|nr:hypothetical protein [Candidatus Peribacteria bacterium]